MNFNLKDNQAPLRLLMPILLCIGLILLLSVAAFSRSSGGNLNAQRSADSTKTALALTSQALLGPFPTSTRPTGTPTDTPTATPAIPSATPSQTRTPTHTPTQFVFETLEARDRDRNPTATSTAVPPTSRPTSTRPPSFPTSTPIIVINTPIPQATSTDSEPPTQPPAPTDPPIVTVLPPVVQTLLP